MLKYITLPLSEEIFYQLDTLNQAEYCIKVNDIDFGDEDKIESAIIYMRNLQLNMKLDFSNVSYEEKCNWILKYLDFSFYDSCIPVIEESILTILANEYIELECIFSPDEVQRFIDEHSSIVDELIRFLVSLNSIAYLLMICHDKDTLSYDQEEFKDVEVITEKPAYLNTISNIIKRYPLQCDGIRLYYNSTVKPVLYEYLVDSINKNFDFYSILLELPSIKFLSIV